QTPADLERSKDLSLARTRPPIEVPGYQAQKFIGAGAYGEVWAGIDRNTGRKVAIKFYAHRSGVDWSLLNREVEKLRFLSADRYVVQLLQVGWTSEPPYYVMELVENGSLDDLLKQHGTFTVAEAVETFREIAIGLAHAHGKGILHCDLKPANILLDQDQRPRLADFGQSRLSHEQKPALGTLFYMAPEQADLEAVPDVRWDVYALGAILHCLLLGYPPHRNDATVGKIDSSSDLKTRLASYRHAIRAAPLLTEHRRLPGMDRALAEIIERCLAVNPEHRYANVQEVLDALATRDRNRAQLPLMVLGFVGPLLVLLVTAFFSWRGYERAVENAEAGYRQWAIKNNQFAANLAAEKVTSEIARYFEIARDEAERPELLPLFVEALSSPALEKLSDPLIKETDIVPQQELFRGEPSRVHLDNYLMDRLRSYEKIAEDDPRAPRFASIFLTDRYGTQVAAAFDDDSAGKTIGKNRANRTYFHGGQTDFPELARVQTNVTHIERTHLSAVFQSTTQKTWKVAISTPIYRELDDQRQFAGVLALTVSLGNFDIAQSDLAASPDRFAVLVDGRSGNEQGTILQHPLFAALLSSPGTSNQDLVSPKYRVDPDLLDRRASEDYADPMSNHPQGQKYNRRWLAGAAPVLPPVDAGANSQSGLVVLVQSDYASVVGPARELGNQFIRNSLWMFAVVIVISLSLWYIVVRLFREPHSGPRPKVGPAADSTPLHGMSTLAAPTRHVD
ncbi:MAG: protein kinase, partial [Planctomycetaceae bacterium]|nr:protein kinase [Planctomycetaceae bacterium]